MVRLGVGAVSGVGFEGRMVGAKRHSEALKDGIGCGATSEFRYAACRDEPFCRSG